MHARSERDSRGAKAASAFDKHHVT